jgi:hypothetical protein
MDNEKMDKLMETAREIVSNSGVGVSYRELLAELVSEKHVSSWEAERTIESLMLSGDLRYNTEFFLVVAVKKAS